MKDTDDSSSTSLQTYTGALFVGFKFRKPKPKPTDPELLEDLIEDIEKTGKAVHKIKKALGCIIL